MTSLHAVILGLIEGLTEFLPISSTGHLIVASRLLGLPETEFLKSFEIAIQSGAILAVIFLYRKRLLTDVETLKRLFIAFLPTAVIGLAVHGVAKRYLLGNATVVLASLFLGGIALIVFERLHKVRSGACNDVARMPYKSAALIGLFQTFAIIPGVSRSAATVVGGLALGLTRSAVVEFSFLLAVPTMLAATGLDLIRSAGAFTSDDFVVLGTGLIVSFLAALVGVKFLLKYVSTRTFEAFGWYRIAAAAAFWVLLR